MEIVDVLPISALDGLPPQGPFWQKQGIHHVQAQGITIHCRGKQAEATLDGEIRGQTPIHARVADECLNVIVP